MMKLSKLLTLILVLSSIQVSWAKERSNPTFDQLKQQLWLDQGAIHKMSTYELATQDQHQEVAKPLPEELTIALRRLAPQW